MVGGVDGAATTRARRGGERVGGLRGGRGPAGGALGKMPDWPEHLKSDEMKFKTDLI